jgi:hypothetical protein
MSDTMKTILSLFAAFTLFVLFSFAVGSVMNNPQVDTAAQPKKFISLKKHLVVQGMPMSKAKKVTPADLKMMCVHLDHGRTESSIVQMWYFHADFSRRDWQKALVVAKERECPIYL